MTSTEVLGEAMVWAEASLPTGPARALPAIGDLVWVSFSYGNPEYPVWQGVQPPESPGDPAAGYVGKFRGVIVDNDDPVSEHRLQVTVPEVDSSPAWATAAMGDFPDAELPEVGAAVWVEYEHGDPAYPRWVGLA